MVIIRERKPNMAFEKLRVPYGILASAVFTLEMYFLEKALKEEVGIIFESDNVTEAHVNRALQEIKSALAQLDRIGKATAFDNAALRDDYWSELNICNAELERILHGLSVVWNRGRPYKHGVVPFGNTTNYDFIIKHLIVLVNAANTAGFALNQRVKGFNKKHPNLKPLPTLRKITAPNNLPPRLKRGLKQFSKWP